MLANQSGIVLFMAQTFVRASCPNCGKPIAVGVKACPHCGWTSLSTDPNLGTAAPMASPFVCPVCGNQDVQKVAAINESGTWEGSSVSVGRFGGTALSGGTVSQASHSGSTRLARLLAPPRKPAVVTPLSILVVLFLTWAFLFSAFVVPAETFDSGSLHVLSIVSLISLTLLIASVIGLIILWMLKKEDRAQHPSKLATWERLLYCAKCHSVYDPQTSQSVPARQIQTIL